MVGKDYPHPEGLEYVRRKWKDALRNPENCQLLKNTSPETAIENEQIIRKAVGRGRYVSTIVLCCKEMGFRLIHSDFLYLLIIFRSLERWKALYS